VRRVVDYAEMIGTSEVWWPRIVCVTPRPTDARQWLVGAFQWWGYWETVSCTRCGYTTWYAVGWNPESADQRRLRCFECSDETLHVVYPALDRRWRDHVVGQVFERLCLPYDWKEDSEALTHASCTGCGATTWCAPGLRRRRAGSIAGARPCVRCSATRAIAVDPFCDGAGWRLPVTIEDRKRLGIFSHARRRGHYALRACVECETVEWYAQLLERVVTVAGVEKIGAERPSDMGPYR
jgi:hypothetical protein